MVASYLYPFPFPRNRKIYCHSGGETEITELDTVLCVMHAEKNPVVAPLRAAAMQVMR